jgi:AraC-like DNA-binding protein
VARNNSQHPQFAETMAKLIGRQLDVEEAARILGMSVTALTRKKRETMAQVMAHGSAADRALVTAGRMQAGLEEIAERNDEMYAIAMETGDLELALSANAAQSKVLEQMAVLAGIGAVAVKNGPTTVNQIGALNMQNVVALPGLQMFHPAVAPAMEVEAIADGSQDQQSS